MKHTQDIFSDAMFTAPPRTIPRVICEFSSRNEAALAADMRSLVMQERYCDGGPLENSDSSGKILSPVYAKVSSIIFRMGEATNREIMDKTGYSKRTVGHAISRLSKLGIVEIVGSGTRANGVKYRSMVCGVGKSASTGENVGVKSYPSEVRG